MTQLYTSYILSFVSNPSLPDHMKGYLFLFSFLISHILPQYYNTFLFFLHSLTSTIRLFVCIISFKHVLTIFLFPYLSLVSFSGCLPFRRNTLVVNYVTTANNILMTHFTTRHYGAYISLWSFSVLSLSRLVHASDASAEEIVVKCVIKNFMIGVKFVWDCFTNAKEIGENLGEGD